MRLDDGFPSNSRRGRGICGRPLESAGVGALLRLGFETDVHIQNPIRVVAARWHLHSQLTLARAPNSSFLYRGGDAAKLNNVQILVLGFLLMAWLSLIAIWAVAPEVFVQSLRLATGETASWAKLLLLAALAALIVLIAVGVLRRWRWIFWLLLLAFLSGTLRVPASILELAGWIPATAKSR